MWVAVQSCRRSGGKVYQSLCHKLLVASRCWWLAWDVVAAGEVVAVAGPVTVSVSSGLFKE
jgi:hypothetical protein